MSEAIFFHQVTKAFDMDGTEKYGRDRESFFLVVPGFGGVEAWRTQSSEINSFTPTGYYGGVEIHSEIVPEDRGSMARLHSCFVTGGECWTTGSSLAFDDVQNWFDYPEYIKLYLKDWVFSHFGIRV